MTNVTTLPAAPRSVSIDFNDPVAVYLDSDIFGQLQRVAKLMASASLVPNHLRGEQKLGDCFLVAAQAFRWRMDPFAVAQATYVVSGKLGYEGKLIAGIVNASGKLAGSLNYEYSGEGDGRTVVVSGKIKGDDAPRTIKGDVAGWKTSNEQWKKNPDQILAYRGAREWARRHMPEVVLGIQADEEIGMGASTVTMRDVTESASPAAAVSGALAALDQKPIEQEADNTAPAASDAPLPPVGAAPPSTGAPTGATAPAVDLTAIAMPLKADGSPDVAAYTAAINAALAKLVSMVEIGEFDLANKPIAMKAGGSSIRNYGVAIAQAKARVEGAA